MQKPAYEPISLRLKSSVFNEVKQAAAAEEVSAAALIRRFIREGLNRRPATNPPRESSHHA